MYNNGDQKINSSALIDDDDDDDNDDTYDAGALTLPTQQQQGGSVNNNNPNSAPATTSRFRQHSLGASSCEPAALNHRLPGPQPPTQPARVNMMSDVSSISNTTLSSLTTTNTTKQQVPPPIASVTPPYHQRGERDDSRRTQVPGRKVSGRNVSLANSPPVVRQPNDGGRPAATSGRTSSLPIYHQNMLQPPNNNDDYPDQNVAKRPSTNTEGMQHAIHLSSREAAAAMARVSAASEASEAMAMARRLPSSSGRQQHVGAKPATASDKTSSLPIHQQNISFPPNNNDDYPDQNVAKKLSTNEEAIQHAIHLSSREAAVCMARVSGASEAMTIPRLSTTSEITSNDHNDDGDGNNSSNSNNKNRDKADYTPTPASVVPGTLPSTTDKDENDLAGVRHKSLIDDGDDDGEPLVFSALPDQRPPQFNGQSRVISNASTNMTPAPPPDDGLTRQNPVGPTHAGAYAIQPGAGMQQQRKGALTPHPRFSSVRIQNPFRSRTLSSRRSSKESLPATTDLTSSIPTASVEHSSVNNNNNNTGTENSDDKRLGLQKEFFLFVVCCAVIIAIAVGLTIGLRDGSGESTGESTGGEGGDNDDNDSAEISIPPSLRARLGLLSSNPDGVFGNKDSPQSQALQWIFVDSTNSTTMGEIYGENFGGIMEETVDLPPRLETRYALATLYFATKGSSWTNSFNFLSHHKHECQWNSLLDGFSNISSVNNEVQCNSDHEGVQCNSEQDVTCITLESNRLVGSLPEEIHVLSNMTHINLSNNQLNGVIPFWDAWLQLQNVLLTQNALTGSIPSNINKLSRLTRLGLSGNMLGNEIPSSIGLLTGLHGLYLSQNKFEGTLPSTIGKLSKLRDLRLDGNEQLTGTLPSSISNLSDLTYLTFGNCKFDGPLPSFLGNITRLFSFLGSGNDLTGSIPWSSFPPQSPMDALALDQNDLSGTLPANLGTLFPYLQELSLFQNSFDGPLPVTLGLLTDMKTLSLRWNELIGTIPNLGKLKELTTLDLAENFINGTIPLELGGLNKLKILQLFGNDISGHIPSDLGLLSNLEFLNLKTNKLSGSVPSELGRLSNLERLILSDNELLTGSIPNEICTLPKLKEICVPDSLKERCECSQCKCTSARR